jgi:hypothetical protein
MDPVDVSAGPRSLGVFENHLPPVGGFHDPIDYDDYRNHLNHWYGRYLKEEDIANFNLCIKTLPDDKYEIILDTHEVCENLLRYQHVTPENIEHILKYCK